MHHQTKGLLRAAWIVFGLAACCTATARADAPIFLDTFYSFEATVDQTGAYVGTVEAFDPENDEFIFIMHDTSGMFSINPLHGYVHANVGMLEVGTHTVTVEAIDIFDESSFVDVEVTVLPAPPEIESVNFYNYGGGMWMIVGSVDSTTPTGTIKFGGLMNGKSTQYFSSGTFMYMSQIYGSGFVTLQAIDADGEESDIVTRHITN
jgi:hypothetical protein